MSTVYIKGEKAQTLRMSSPDPENTRELDVRITSMSVQWQEHVIDGQTDEAWIRLHNRVTGKHAIVGSSINFMLEVMYQKVKKMGYPIVTSGLLSN